MAVYEQLIVVAQCPDGGSFMIIKKEHFEENTNTINTNKKKITLPINSILAVSVVTYLLTFIKKGAIEGLANITNSFIFLVFILVNSLVIIDYYKKKRRGIKNNVNYPIISGQPWYAYLGLVISIVYFGKSFTYSS